MATPTLWERLDVELPNQLYNVEAVTKQADDSTTWASHSHTPVSVSAWKDFDACIAREAGTAANSTLCPTDLHKQMEQIRRIRVEEEEDVTTNTLFFLQPLGELTGVEFSSTTKYAVSNPELIASRQTQSIGQEGWTFVQPKTKNREKKRREQVEEMSENVLFTLETKPVWKFQFLLDQKSTEIFLNEWEVPAGYTPEDLYNQRALPRTWSKEKRKVFHLLRQVYGQMTSSKRKYGVIHIYEKWWFCCRTDQGELNISRPFSRECRSPSVLQALVTLANFDDIFLPRAAVHPGLAQKANVARAAQRKRDLLPKVTGKMGAKKTKGSSSANKSAKGSKGGGATKNNDGFLVHEVCLWDCTLVDVTDNVQLLTPRNHPSVLIKLQRDPRAFYVASEMKQEASIYDALSKRGDVGDLIPRYFGYSAHLGVSMLFLGMEGSNFDDIGLENLSSEIKLSAVDCLRQLSAIGLLHNDIALRNIVQSKIDPTKAKVVDFGRAEFCDDKFLLEEQVKALEWILGLVGQ